MSHVCITPIWSRISRQDSNIFQIDWKDQDKREIFKNFQDRDNNSRTIVLSCSRAALVAPITMTIFSLSITHVNEWYSTKLYLCLLFYMVCYWNNFKFKYSFIKSKIMVNLPLKTTTKHLSQIQPGEWKCRLIKSHAPPENFTRPRACERKVREKRTRTRRGAQ